MSRTSTLGWVARTVLNRGSSTGLAPPPRGAPSRASRRRTAAVPAAAALVSPVGAGRVGRGRGGRAPLRDRPDADERAARFPGAGDAGDAGDAEDPADAGVRAGAAGF